MTANRLDVGLELNLVANDDAADVEILVPPQPEMSPIDVPLHRVEGSHGPIRGGSFLASDNLEIDVSFCAVESRRR